MPTGRRPKPSASEQARAKNKVNAQAVAGKKPQPTKGRTSSTTRVVADRAQGIVAGSTRAGKSTRSTAQRQRDNAGVKDGTIRMGRNGKSYNVYDAKTGTWKRGVVKAASTPRSTSMGTPGQKPPGAAAAKAAKAKKPIGRDTGNHRTTYYANGTARVWDPKQVKFVTVGKNDPRYPKK